MRTTTALRHSPPLRRSAAAVLPGQPARAQLGFLLLEVLITIVLVGIGLLGLAGLQARTAVMEMEAYQRTQALFLAQDMAERIAANKADAAHYVGDGYGAGGTAACGGAGGYAYDLCTWGNALRGATEKSGTVNVGTLQGGRGCIAAKAAGRYQVIVAWQGRVPTVAPAVRCGADDPGAEPYRRAVVVPVHLANLRGA